MSRHVLSLVCGVVLAWSADAAVAGEKYAFLVGVKKYLPNRGFSGLPYAENDVTKLAEVLERSGYAAENILIMTLTAGAENPELYPSAAAINDAFGRFLARLDEDDSLVVAFSGHGVQFDGEDHAYFCPTDADLTDRTKLVSLEDVYKGLEKRCKAGTKLLLVDACRKNEAPPPPIPKGGEPVSAEAAELLQQMAPPLGVAALFSCSAGELSWEDAQLGHGVFFHFVIEALSGKGDMNGDREVSLAELELYAGKGLLTLYAANRIHARQTPKRKGGESYGAAAIVRIPVLTSGATAGEVRDDNGLGMSLVWCPAGTFTMGGDAAPVPDSPEAPAKRSVTIPHGFWIGRHEVTQSEYERVMGTNPSLFTRSTKGVHNNAYAYAMKAIEGVDTTRFPVECVNSGDALEFCSRLSDTERRATRLPEGWRFSLPTEAQWEYACRAGTKTTFWFGDALDPTKANTSRSQFQGDGLLKAVGNYPPNPWGLFDVHGNVAEWCHVDKSLGVGDAPQHGPGQKAERLFMARGGSASTYSDRGGSGDRDFRFNGIASSLTRPGDDSTIETLGFRVVMTRDE